MAATRSLRELHIGTAERGRRMSERMRAAAYGPARLPLREGETADRIWVVVNGWLDRCSCGRFKAERSARCANCTRRHRDTVTSRSASRKSASQRARGVATTLDERSA